jgi:hypothetical protein
VTRLAFKRRLIHDANSSTNIEREWKDQRKPKEHKKVVQL